MKKRKFAEGGGTSVDVDPIEGIENFYYDAVDGSDGSDDYGSRGTKRTGGNAAPKAVTKEELAKSGLSLRDYMNKQQGLTRRKEPYSGTGGSGGGRGPTAEELESYGKTYSGTGGSGRGGQGGPTAEELRQERYRVKMPSEEAVQKGMELALPAGAGLSAVARLAKGLASRTARPAAEVVQQASRTARPAAEVSQKALPAPMPRLGFDKAGAKAAERGARSEARRAEMLKENARRSGLREDAPEASVRAVREKLGGSDWSLPMKKGGKVQKYAKGGAIDGCAQRGKTKGRYL